MGSQLISEVYNYQADCHNPDSELCSVNSPHPQLYMYTVLTPDIPFDDLGAHWVVDLRKFPPVTGAVKVLRVATTTGDVHAIRLKLLYDKAKVSAGVSSKLNKVADAQASNAPTPMKSSSTGNSGLNTKVSGIAGSIAPAPAPDIESKSKSANSAQVSALSGQGDGRRDGGLERNSSASLPPKAGSQQATSQPNAGLIEAPKAHCFDGICMGDSVKKLKAPFESVMPLSEQLRKSFTGEKTPDFERVANKLEDLYSKGNIIKFEKLARDWIRANGNDWALSTNIFMLIQAYGIADRALSSGSVNDIVDLSKYFLPNEARNGVSLKYMKSYIVDLDKDSLSFVKRRHLRFDLGFVELMKKVNVRSCDVFGLRGIYVSKSGYPTMVDLDTNDVGDFRVSGITRLFADSSVDVMKKLNSDLVYRYREEISSRVAHVEYRNNVLSLSLQHPVMSQILNDNRYGRKFYWENGWLSFRDGNIYGDKVMSAISKNNKNTIASCKIKSLPMD